MGAVKEVTDASFEAEVLKSDKPVVLRVWNSGQNHYFTIPAR